MAVKNELLLVLLFMHVLLISAQNQDIVYLQALKDTLKNTPPNWVGSDPCGVKWDGITCTDSRVTSISLSSVDLSGELSGDIAYLSELQTLDLSYNKGLTGSLTPDIGNLNKLSNLILVGCSFNGPLPDTLGSLSQLRYLSLNSNSFTGRIPASLGKLSKLFWLDLADNELTGSIPVSEGTTPGLDLLVNTKHFHFGKNKLSGEIPAKLFSSKMTLIYVLFEDNQFTGFIPSTLGLVQTLAVLWLDRNSLSGNVPSNINNLTRISQLFLSNNKLSGPFPNLTGMSGLNYLDISNNSFKASVIPPWVTSLKSLTTLMMQDTGLHGEVPVGLFSIPQIETVVLRNNQLNGTLDFGNAYSTHLQLIDISNNLISGLTHQSSRYTAKLILVKNPICTESETKASYCDPSTEFNSSYLTPPNNCNASPTCGLGQVSSPSCNCSYPYTGTLSFRAPSFSDLGNSTIYTSLQNSMMVSFKSNQLPVDSVSLSRPIKNLDDYLEVNLEIFPFGSERFNRSGILRIGFVLSNQTYKPPHTFGPYFFIGNNYDYFLDAQKGKHKSISIGIIIGVSVGSCVLLLLLVIAGLYAFRQKGRAERAIKKNSPFASWGLDNGSDAGGVPQLKGARWCSFEELKQCTNNFSEEYIIGSGGYGKVYKGTLNTGQVIAIKRAKQGSLQGAQEFKTEIELLSRIHHKNVVALVGFCYEQGEQILVYEYMPNGTLKDNLLGTAGIRLNWMRRLRLALDSAKGLTYLHELANPPIIHRDIKSNNILLDDHLNAKVADFGLSKLLGDDGKGYVSTQVKGTLGYMDPEYYMTQKLTEKSDVYSFGVVLLELLTARSPIQNGKYVVREVSEVFDQSRDPNGVYNILDPSLGSPETLGGLTKFVNLAMNCVKDSGAQRPNMGEVVREIESIIDLAALSMDSESSVVFSSERTGKGDLYHPYNDSVSDVSSLSVPFETELRR